MTDPDIQALAAIDDASVVISTVPSVHDSINLIARMKGGGRRVKVIVTAESELDALTLYEKKADYVVLPRFIGGLQLAHLLEGDKTLKTLEKMRDRDITLITEHP
jgi:voltage-gated potassium channel Kch